MGKKTVVKKRNERRNIEVIAGFDKHSVENKRERTRENLTLQFKVRARVDQPTSIRPTPKKQLSSQERLQKFKKLRDRNLKLAKEVALPKSFNRTKRTSYQSKMASEVQESLPVNGSSAAIEDKDDMKSLNEMKEKIQQKMAPINNIEIAVNGKNGLENGHSDTKSVSDSEPDVARGRKNNKRSSRSTPTKAKKKSKAKITVTNNVEDDTRSENSSSIFSKDTEDENSFVTMAETETSGEFVDISLELTPEIDLSDENEKCEAEANEKIDSEHDQDEEIDVVHIDKSEGRQQEVPTVDSNILSTLRERIRFSLSPRKQANRPADNTMEQAPTREADSPYKGISGRRPLRSPQFSTYRSFSSQGTSTEDACIKRKAETDIYSLPSKRVCAEDQSRGWNFNPFKWFSSKSQTSTKSTTRQMHDEVHDSAETVDDDPADISQVDTLPSIDTEKLHLKGQEESEDCSEEISTAPKASRCNVM